MDSFRNLLLSCIPWHNKLDRNHILKLRSKIQKFTQDKMASNDASDHNEEERVQTEGQNSAAAGGTSTTDVPEGEQGDQERPMGNCDNATQNVAKGDGTADSQTKAEEMGQPGHTPPAVQPQQPHTSEEQGDGRRAVCPSSADYLSSGAASVNPAHPQGAAQPQISSAREASTREQPTVGFRFPVQETHGVVQTERGDNMESASISPDRAQFQRSEDGLELTQKTLVMESVGDGSPSGPRSPDPSQIPDSSVAPQHEFAEGGLGLSGAAPVAEQGDVARSNMASNDVDLSTGRSCLHCEKWQREVLLPCGHKNLCYQCFFCKTFWCHHLRNGQPWCLVCGLPYTDIYDQNLRLQALIYNDRRQRVTRCGCYCRRA